jgi:hypothetical protein
MKNINFIQLYLNDFAKAKQSFDPRIVELPYSGFVRLRTDETILQTTNSSINISFVSTVKAELVDSCNKLVKDISDNFYYIGFIDHKGVSQISFEFGYIGVDYYSKPLHLRLTDNVNGNIYYSTNFLITNYEDKKSTRFDYFNTKTLEGTNYELAPFKQSIRLSNVYFSDVEDETEKRSRIDINGTNLNFKSTVTYYNKYICDGIDIQTKRALDFVFRHSVVYIDGQRCTLKDFTKDERKGTTNMFSGEFIVNPQDEYYEWAVQVFEDLKLLTLELPHNTITTITGVPAIFKMNFNKPIEILSNLAIKLYKNDTFVANGTPSVDGQSVEIDFGAYIFENGVYKITVSEGIYSELLNFDGINIGDWKFTIVPPDYSEDDYDSNDYLTN